MRPRRRLDEEGFESLVPFRVGRPLVPYAAHSVARARSSSVVFREPHLASPPTPIPHAAPPTGSPEDWSVDSWRSRPDGHPVAYSDAGELDRAIVGLRSLPPLVTSWEIERLRQHLAQAEAGHRFLLQGGDCAETLADCQAPAIARKLKILLQMSLVLVHGLKKPVIRVGRFAGQYAKPRSRPVETHQGVTLPSYFGDLYNSPAFTPEARRPNPAMMLKGYQHAAMTLNFIRALVDGGFADLHHPEYWDLSFFRSAGLTPALRDEYTRLTTTLADGLRFMEALGEARIEELTRVEFFASHEGLNLHYESAQTRGVPRRPKDHIYTLTTHLPWIGERTRQLDGAHVEFFRGVRNPIGLKIGPKTTPEELVELSLRLNSGNEPGRLVLITRLGHANVRPLLPALVGAMRARGRAGLWVCDPMHGNTITTASGVKTRTFDDIRRELQATLAVFQELDATGPGLGGVHFELTGDDVTECVGGATGITEAHLSTNYASLCDPRLNYHQALELAMVLARGLAERDLARKSGRAGPGK
jgi:3-deoxy-7-phosphoheptulonate synthase